MIEVGVTHVLKMKAAKYGVGAAALAVVVAAVIFGPLAATAAMAQTANPRAAQPPAAGLPPGTEILSDTKGVDFAPYVRRLHNDIQRNWDPMIPEEAKPPKLSKGVVALRFTILPDGQIGSMKLESSSGKVALDKAAWYAITSEGQFPALPSAFHGPLLELRIKFFYNVPPPAALAVTPPAS